jgi:hypothetical protein
LRFEGSYFKRSFLNWCIRRSSFLDSSMAVSWDWYSCGTASLYPRSTHV